MSADRDWQRREDELFAAIEHMARGDKILPALELALQTGRDGMRPDMQPLVKFIQSGEVLSQSQLRLLETYVILMLRDMLAADRPRLARVLKTMQGDWRGRIEGSASRRSRLTEAKYAAAALVMQWRRSEPQADRATRAEWPEHAAAAVARETGMSITKEDVKDVLRFPHRVRKYLAQRP